MIEQTCNQFVFYLSTLPFTTNYAFGRIIVFLVLLLKRQITSIKVHETKQTKLAKIDIFLQLWKHKRTPLDTAIRLNDLEFVKHFTEVRPETVNTIITDAGSSPLHILVSSGSEEICNFLLQNGADLNAKENHYSWSPLHYAAKNCKLEIAKILVQKGADVNTITIWNSLNC